MAETVGGANIATTGNGTANASSYYTNTGAVSANAFDGSGATRWATANGSVSGAWVSWDFGAGYPKQITEVRLLTPADRLSVSGNPEGPRVVRLEYSDDGTTWYTYATFAELPMAYSVSASLSVGSGVTSISLPSALVAIRTGVSVAMQLPALLSSSLGGSSAGFGLPSMLANAYGHDSTGEQDLSIMLPSLSVSARGGASTKATLPKLSAQASGTVTNLADTQINLPSLSVTSGVTVAGMANAAISLPPFSSTSFAGAICSITVGKLTTQATGTMGAIGRAQVTLPLFEATATATAENYGSANIILPSLAMGSASRAALTLPSLELLAIGTATIAATYEAYAVNLNHADPTSNDELTRYTNFPFTHIVRYQGSYFGVAADGLYLLEGATDYAATPTAIPWAFKTAQTDFKEPKQKTVAAAYFGGRLGPAATITLYAGEGAGVAYAHSTPRGATAQNYRQVFGKGVKARYYSLGAAGTGTLELDDIEFDIHTLTRRI